MSYGQVAVDAIRVFQNQQSKNLLQAWRQSLHSNHKPDKSCPRVAFLGLCENNHVISVPPGNYRQKSIPSVLKQRAVRIRNIIMNANPPALPTNGKTSIWAQVGGTGQDQGIVDVVYSLFNNNLLA